MVLGTHTPVGFIVQTGVTCPQCYSVAGGGRAGSKKEVVITIVEVTHAHT